MIAWDKKRFLPFFFACLLLWIGAGVLLCLFPKGELHILLNGCHTPWLDTFFRYYTKLAELPFYLLALVPLFFAKYRWCSYYYAVSEAVSALITTIIKHCFNMPRPASFFGETIEEQVNLVEGVRLHQWHSFPSGHTCAFFVFFTVIFLLRWYYYSSRNTASVWKTVRFDVVSVLLVFLTALGSYSRIYLSQHFLLDCFVGSLIGVIMPTLVLFLFIRKGWDRPYYFTKSKSE